MTSRSEPGVGDLPDEVLGASVRRGVLDDPSSECALLASNRFVEVRGDRSDTRVDVRGVARYRVVRGSHVVVDPLPGVAADAVRTWLHGTVTALLAAQQGRFALHASVIDVDGCRIAVAGDSGAGKSTTVVATMLAGGHLVSDDVAVLEPTANGMVSIPYGRAVHLPSDAALRLGLDTSTAVAASDKLVLAPPAAASAALDSIAVLRVADVDAPRLVAIDRLRAVGVVRRHTFRRRLLAELYAHEVFAWQAEIARRVPVHRLVRPPRWSVEPVVDALRGLAVRRAS